MRIDAITNDATVISELGSRVARERLSRNLTQGELAARAGISPRALWAFEKGQSVQLVTLIHVLRALGHTGNLNLLLPEVAFSPLAVEPAKPPRRRAGKKRVEQ
jgi:transcriptional regulator with XRE-family HTH domain